MRPEASEDKADEAVPHGWVGTQALNMEKGRNGPEDNSSPTRGTKAQSGWPRKREP